MKPFRTLDDVDVRAKRVLLRVDLNVPTENGRVSDTTRLERVAPAFHATGGSIHSLGDIHDSHVLLQ